MRLSFAPDWVPSDVLATGEEATGEGATTPDQNRFDEEVVAVKTANQSLRHDLSEHVGREFQERNSARVSAVRAAVHGRVMLVVEDEPETRRLFSSVFQSGGYGSAEARNAEDAWRLLQEGLLPGGVLLDLRMPGPSGLAFLQQLRADPRYVALPVTVLTGDYFIDRSTETMLRALGATLLFKPIKMKEILAIAADLQGA